MSFETNVAPGGGEAAPVAYTEVTPADENASYNSPSSAARALASWRHKQREEPAAPDTVETPTELPSQEDSAAPHKEAPGETTEASDPADKPTIEPPRSWTKEEKEAFKALPPEHQQRISERERAREVEIRNRQNEIAEQRKASEAERQQALQARQQYEQALPQLLQALYAQQNGEFSDVRSMADVERLAREDPMRYSLWDAQQKKVAHVRQQTLAIQQQRAQEQAQWWQNYVKEQDQQFLEIAPEFKDAEKAPKLQAQVRSYLKDVGITDNELQTLWSSNPTFRDARTQKIIWEASQFRAAKEAVKNAPPKPVPPVQRPGTAPAKGERASADLQALETKLERTGSAKDAAALLMAKRKAAARS